MIEAYRKALVDENAVLGKTLKRKEERIYQETENN
jgi:hypothetical protein